MSDTIQGMDKLLAKLDKLQRGDFANAALTAGAEHLRNVVMDYPPATEANRPGRWRQDKKGYTHPMSYYERGRGTWYPVMQKKTLFNRGRLGKSRGAIAARGPQKAIIAGYKLIPNSEDLKHRWAIWSASRFHVILGNNASYARVVHDSAKQARIHAARGWKTIQAVLQREGPKVMQFVIRELQNVLRG